MADIFPSNADGKKAGRAGQFDANVEDSGPVGGRKSVLSFGGNSSAQNENRRPLDAVAVRLDLKSASGPDVSKTFPLPVKEIKIGRDKNWADFIIPDAPEFRTVGGCHLTLERQASGAWIAVRSDKYYFNVRGLPVEYNAPLVSGDTIVLGTKTGPHMTFSLVFDAASGQRDIELTTENDPIIPPWRLALWKHARKVYTALGFVCVALVGLGITQWMQWQRINALTADVEKALTTQTMRTEGFSDATIDRLQSAAYMVIECAKVAQREPCSEAGYQRALATAWALEPKLLVTNVHVAKLVDEARRSNMEICVRGYVPEKRGEQTATQGTSNLSPAYCVERWTAHPGKDPFDQTMAAALNGDPADSNEFSEITRPGAYDVALLVMRDPVPEDTTLPLAKMEALEQLDAGTPVAFAGYLLRDIDGQYLASFEPTPFVHYGNVSRLTDFLMFGGNEETRQLVHNTIPLTGGASGGPVINEQGEVIAVVSSGTVVPIPKGAGPETRLTPSASLVNYAQRADLVWHLWKPEEHKFEEQVAAAQWREAIKLFRTPRETVVKDTLGTIGEDFRTGFAVATGETVKDTLGKWPSASIFELEFEAGKEYMVLAYSDRTDAMRLRLLGGEECFADGRWPALFLRAGTSTTAELALVSRAPVKRNYEIIVYERPPAEAARSSASSTPAISCIDWGREAG